MTRSESSIAEQARVDPDSRERHREHYTTTTALIREMLELQESINRQISPDWRTQRYPWYRAIWIECAELMEHHGWKWWKQQTSDLEQIHLELIDIWHFGLSDCLQTTDASMDLIADSLYRGIFNNSVAPTQDLISTTEDFARDCLQLKRFATAGFAQLLQVAQLDFQVLVKLYIGKNVLNSFRQDNGYKQGSYRKIWLGQEDNEHLIQILNETDTLDIRLAREIYKALAERYDQG